MALTKKQKNMLAWIAVIVVAAAILLPGDSGRETYGRQAQGGKGICKALDESYLKSYTDLGLKCGYFTEDGKQITFQQAQTTYANQLCDLRCYDCAGTLTPVGAEICFGKTNASSSQTDTAITGAPPTGTVTYSNGDDWVAAKITIKNTLSDPISGIVSLEVTTEDEAKERKGFGPSFTCESPEDIQKTFSIAAGKTETTTLTSTNLPKGAYSINVISVNRCCKYGCDSVSPFEFGDPKNQIILNLPGKTVPTYTCSKEGGKCKSSPDQGDTLISGTCPSGQACYDEPSIGKLFSGFGFGSFGEWWSDRSGWQQIAIVVGIFSIISLVVLLRDRQKIQ